MAHAMSGSVVKLENENYLHHCRIYDNFRCGSNFSGNYFNSELHILETTKINPEKNF